MKKLISLMLALVLVLSMATVAFAAEASASTAGTVTMKKTYKLIGDGTSPQETFEFTVTPVSVTDAASDITTANMPTVTVDPITFNAGEATAAGTVKEVTINLPAYTSVGIYTYTIKETDKNVPGVTYFTGDITLVVTVTQDTDGKLRVAAVHTESPVDTGNTNGKKSDEFENTYSAGKLNLTKNVTGNMGDQSKFFKVTVTLTGETGKAYQDIAVSGGSYTSNPVAVKVGEAAEIWLKHGDTVSLSNIPYGVTYTVVEDDYTGGNGGYDAAEYAYVDGTDGAATNEIDSALETATVTNNKGTTVDTGITMDSVPYILLVAVCAGAAVLFIINKRRSVDF